MTSASAASESTMKSHLQSFDELTLPANLMAALKAMKFDAPTPIQAQAIPHALANRDVLGCAQTGTGKTAAFSIPTIARLLRNPKKSALILTPTRELAAQIADVMGKLLSRSPEIKMCLLIGGVGMGPQVKALSRRPQILIATPGRMLDHLRRGSVSLMNLDILVLDEADRMLDMGFAPQLNEILRLVPKTRQTLLFSATMPSEIEKLAMKLMRDPVRVSIGQVSKPIERITQEVLVTTAQKKNELVLEQINAREGSIIIFARTQVRTDRLARFLNTFGLEVGRIHGGRSQGQRTQAMDAFRSGKIRVLVATDIAARGIDVAHIAHVINFDLPQVAEDYVHRIGRTARAGADGKAVSFVTPEDRDMWREIEKLTAKKGGANRAPLANLPEAPKQLIPEARAQKRPSQPSPQKPQQMPRKTHRKGFSSKPSATKPAAGKSVIRPLITPAN